MKEIDNSRISMDFRGKGIQVQVKEYLKTKVGSPEWELILSEENNTEKGIVMTYFRNTKIDSLTDLIVILGKMVLDESKKNFSLMRKTDNIIQGLRLLTREAEK